MVSCFDVSFGLLLFNVLCRIERLWRELWSGVTNFYYQLFYSMETEGILRLEMESHVLALHLVYKPLIQRHLNRFRQALIRRPLRTESNRSPLQLWIRGQVLDPNYQIESQVCSSKASSTQLHMCLNYSYRLFMPLP